MRLGTPWISAGQKSRIPSDDTKIGRFFNQLRKRCDLEKIGPSQREADIANATAVLNENNTSIVTDLGSFMRRVDSFAVENTGILL